MSGQFADNNVEFTNQTTAILLKHHFRRSGTDIHFNHKVVTTT